MATRIKLVMATFHGTLPEYVGNTADWEVYTYRLQQYFMANDITAVEKQRAILLSACGSETIKLIHSLVPRETLEKMTFDEIAKLVKDHYHPKPSEIVSRCHFNSASRNPAETVASFLARLRKLTEYCNYGKSLDEMLRDRLVCGIDNERLQRTLLSEKTLTLAKAYELCQAAERNAKALRANTQRSEPIHATTANTPKTTETRCHRCDGLHQPSTCRFKDVVCNFCNKKGHIAKACRTRKRQQRTSPNNRLQNPTRTGEKQDRRTNCLDGDNRHSLDSHTSVDKPSSRPQALTLDYATDNEYPMFKVTADKTAPYTTSTIINGAHLRMEIDTGAALSLISETTYRRLWSTEYAPRLSPTNIRLRTYTGEGLKVKGSALVTVQCNGQHEDLNLLVVEGSGPSLLGRDWLSAIRLDWQEVRKLHAISKLIDSRLEAMLQRREKLFAKGLGTIQGVKASLLVNDSAQPYFAHPRNVPYAIREKVEKELARLQNQGIIEPVRFARWAAPLVPVQKKDGNVRICGDYKLTVNKAAKVDSYPIPRIDDLFASLAGGKLFSKLDLAHAYQQLLLDDASKEFVVVNTNKGLFRYNRLPFGVAAAPTIFQRTMETILQGLPKVCVYLDDILVSGTSEDDHIQNLQAVLKRLEDAGVRLKREKCEFLLPEVVYLGHKITAQGLQPTNEKVKAITAAPTPNNVSQLKSYLGMINYYGKFFPNLATLLAPLYALLRKNAHWCWEEAQDVAFQKSKELLSSNTLLTHYDPTKELLLSCDASPYGIGAVLSHKMEDGSERPVAYASRSLSQPEKNYAQLDKEALSIVFGVKKFHHYLCGRKFTILCDHKPLKHIFNENKGIPTMASSRVQRWALTLGAYDYVITYKPGQQNANADGVSRLPLPLPVNSVMTPIPADLVLLFETLNSTAITATDIKRMTDRDPVLSRVRDYVLRGWTNPTDTALQPFKQKFSELSVQDGCLLWGNRVAIPQPAQEAVLKQLHAEHPGIARMKSLARSYVWWPGIDAAVESMVKQCEKCQQCQKLPSVAPLHPWDWLDRPWARIHADYAGPFMGKLFLLMVDAHSKWLEVHIVPSATSLNTIEKMRSTFATHGLPEMLVTDNGSAFTSQEFTDFLRKNGIRHVTSAPYHPATNGLAERAVQTFKATMMKAPPNTSIETRVSRFLFHYRLTPHSTTGISPAELLLSRRPRTNLDQLRPDLARKIRRQQDQQKQAHDQRVRARTFMVGEPVLTKNFSEGPVWLKGSILRLKGALTMDIELEDGRVVRRHIDHIRSRPSPSGEVEEDDNFPLILPQNSADTTASNDENPPPETPESTNNDVEPPSAVRRSNCIRRPPDRLQVLT